MKLARYVNFREEKFGGIVFETRSKKIHTLDPTPPVGEIEAGTEQGPLRKCDRGAGCCAPCQ